MFNRYWRTYPWWLQLALALLLVFTLSSFGTYLVLALVPRMTGVAFKDLVSLTPLSPPATIRAGLIAQAIAHIGMFTAPALLFAVFTHPRSRQYLGLRRPGKAVHWLIVTGIMLGLIPVFLWGEAWMMKHLHFGDWATRLQEQNDNLVKAFLKLKSTGDLTLLLTILAFLPALGEELLFRGVLLRLFHRRAAGTLAERAPIQDLSASDAQRRMIFPVIFTALLFATIHFNPYGFAFIFIAGCILALIYYLTGSLLCSIWAHFLYNGVQVAGYFFIQETGSMKSAIDEQLPIAIPLVGLLIFAGSFYALVRTQTPLSPNWSADFEEGEEELAN